MRAGLHSALALRSLVFVHDFSAEDKEIATEITAPENARMKRETFSTASPFTEKCLLNFRCIQVDWYYRLPNRSFRTIILLQVLTSGFTTYKSQR